MRILVVEDEPRVAGFLERGLREEGHAVDVAATGEEALDRTRSFPPYDVVVLDVLLPGLDGFEVARRLRARGNSSPILMLTARDAREDVIRGLDLGADDYLAKPFDFSVLLARLRALVRRHERGDAAVLQWEDVVLDRLRREARRGGRRLDLTPTEFRLLEAVMEGAGKIVPRNELLERVWGLDFEPGTSVIEVHLANLRSKLEAGGASRVVHTIRGQGFRMAAFADEG